MKRWQLQEAKNRFSEVVDKALTEGPQWVTRHGKDAVVVVSAADYQPAGKPQKSFREFLLNGPKIDFEIDFDADRKKSRSRNFSF
ncbi:MAG: type II toxin-antitoxin system Phd/YefM family antitoxin [Reyranellaceae bacterium]